MTIEQLKTLWNLLNEFTGCEACYDLTAAQFALNDIRDAIEDKELETR